MILLDCPNCGRRNVSEFRYGGEAHKRPDPNAATPADWADYVYMRDNPHGVLREWWYHRQGCGQWFLAERHTRTHTVLGTTLWKVDS